MGLVEIGYTEAGDLTFTFTHTCPQQPTWCPSPTCLTDSSARPSDQPAQQPPPGRPTPCANQKAETNVIDQDTLRYLLSARIADVDRTLAAMRTLCPTIPPPTPMRSCRSWRTCWLTAPKRFGPEAFGPEAFGADILDPFCGTGKIAQLRDLVAPLPLLRLRD